jgi:putative chitinase
MINRKMFYDRIRSSLFGVLHPLQFDGIQGILNEYERIGNLNLEKLAYILGTVYHETGATMQPVEENGKGAGKAYGKKLKMGDGPGHRIPYDKPDQIYYGRGHTQNTWYENYERLTAAAKKLGHDWDFLNHPDLLLQDGPSIWATFYAMTHGLYTGRKLSDFFNDEEIPDWYNARMIINGHDQALRIEEISLKFFHALK